MTESEILSLAAIFLEENIIKEWEAQGHHMTGAWEESINREVTGNEVEGFASSYGAIVNAGVMADRIPYGGQGTGAKVSKYIQGLYSYFKAKGKSDKEALSYAFATAKVQKKEGMSTIASRAYSSTGERQRFLQTVIETIGAELDEKVFTGLHELIITEANEVASQTI